MKNLNKFSKAELIKQYKKLEEQNSNQTLFFKFINYIIYFKGLIIKITLIGLIIRWIKKYSLVKKLWHIFSLIGSTLLGFSLIDIYSWDVISWIKDTSIYKWYLELVITPKTDFPIENPSKFPKGMIERTSIETNGNEIGNQKSDEISNKINRDSEKTKVNDEEVLNQEEFNSIDETNNYKYYFMLGSIVIISGVAVWCYYNDIKPGDASNAVLEKIKSFRSWLNNDSNNIINNNPGNNSMNIPTNINRPVEDIQLVDNTNTPNNNQSSVLTSPSLENLNEQAESSWSEISSPDSDKTVTPASISESNASSSSFSSSSSSSSLINASNLIRNTWRSSLSKEANDKINFIESSLLNNEVEVELTDYFAFIINEYNSEIEVYNYIKSQPDNNLEMLKAMKESLYYFRDWIAEYKSKIFTDSTVSIEIGSITDSPRKLTKNIV